MKNLTHTILLACAAAAMSLAACDSGLEEPAAPREGSVCYPNLRISVSEMTMAMDNGSRALTPMSPDNEKYVTSLAIFEFNNEGLHDQSESSYHFIDFLEGTVDGMAGVGIIKPTQYGIVETSLAGISLQNHSNGTICCVANVSKEQVSDLYKNSEKQGHSYGRLTLDYFKSWALPFEYETTTDIVDEESKADAVYDETTAGHLKTMYMFGFYQGKIEASAPTDIWVDLGRLASRLDITVINETGRDIEERLGYHFDNVCSSAYFFPIKMSMPPKIGAGMTRTLICKGPWPLEGEVTPVEKTFPKGATHTRYFYAAAHSAKDKSEATSLHLFWNSRVVGDGSQLDEGGSAVIIPLSNVPDPEAATVPNGYSLSRNTRYHFTIHLRRVPNPPAAPVARSVACTGHTGDYIVYLP